MGAADPSLWGVLMGVGSFFALLLIFGWAFFPHWRE